MAYVGDKLMAAEGRWFMGRFAPRELLDGIDRYLRLEVGDDRVKLLETIRLRAEEIAEQDQDMPVDPQSAGMLALTSTVLAAYETLLPVFDDDPRRTILFLRHMVGAVARRPFEVVFEALGRRKEPLDVIERACRKEGPLYGTYYDIAFDRQSPDAFEMRVERCFFRDHFARHGSPALTTVMCAWDANWMRAVDPAVSGLRAERTTLMSQGDDACRFRVVATDDPLATYHDALE
ncbi:L-2-amino-thiazoline-4-carboxylic acid hydrolase [Actinoplanes sp. TBRC 11911]|uniref:L-2-amino-thiazoline-4-carboxylic acid hydrolase n=1 Tax=Actinoplanes sp. TBRC 11911 TaxID=2729386 RepID=UPI00145F209D|nr:L-2-amino-thiazoline-4-carboxylic acid hydrolase [Actinoplanes sp. TBRC 11911]NMO51384.1 L-2-amino-thiazoline-4-carboxylic acid hydrolase [Actinoplanes sp. TBRC 11911]